jgi:hypothetical protein
MGALGFGSIVIAFFAMAYLGPAIAVAAHVILREGYLSQRTNLTLWQRFVGVLEALVIGLLWLPTLLLLLLRAALGR